MGNYPFIILLQEVLDVVYVSQSLCFMHKLPGEITYSFLFQFCQISLIVAFLSMGALCRIGEEIIYVVIIGTWGSFVYKGSVEVYFFGFVHVEEPYQFCLKFNIRVFYILVLHLPLFIEQILVYNVLILLCLQSGQKPPQYIQLSPIIFFC